MPILEARGLTVRKGGHDIVRVEHFALAGGDVHVLLGPNGAGKTTLMRGLNGLEQVTGELLFNGTSVCSGADRLRLRRHTAAVFQQAFLLSTTVRGNVESSLRFHGVPAAERRRRGSAALEMLGINHLAERRRSGLSGGEAQRVSIARALAADPAIIFLDEPMASLDPPTRRSLLADLEAIFRRLRTTVLWVTHDTEEALAVADRVTFLADGAVVQEGTTAEVFNSPNCEAVADFLGIDVWLEGVVEDGDGELSRFVVADGEWLVCPACPPGPAFACIHPEDVILFRTPPDDNETSLRNVLETTLRAVRVAGRSRLASLDWHGCRIDALVTRAACEHLGLEAGQVVYAAVKAVAIQVVPRGGFESAEA